MSRIVYGPTTSANALRGREIAEQEPIDGDALVWHSGTEQWTPAPPGGGIGADDYPPNYPHNEWGSNTVWYTPLTYGEGTPPWFSGPRIIAVPYWSGAGGTTQNIRIECRDTGTAKARAGIYSHGLYRPATLVAQGSEWTLNASESKTSAISAVLEPAKLYWFALHISAGVILLSGRIRSGYEVLGTSGNGTPWPGVSVTSAYTGSLPATFPAGSAVQSSPWGVAPYIAIAYAS